MNYKIKSFLLGNNQINSKSQDIGFLFLRLFVGLALCTFFEKFFPKNGIWGPQEWFIQDTANMGFPFPAFFAWIAALYEFFGGILLILGLFTRPAAILNVFVTFTATFIYHKGDIIGSGLLSFFFMIMCICILLFGAGKFSLEYLITKQHVKKIVTMLMITFLIFSSTYVAANVRRHTNFTQKDTTIAKIDSSFNKSFAHTQVMFEVKNIKPNSSLKIGIRGNEYPLSWEKSIFLEKMNENYGKTIAFKSGLTFFEYKYVLESSDGKVTFELDRQENRLGILNDSNRISLHDTWDKMPVYDISALPLIPVEKLIEDARLLGKVLWEVHPGVERYQDSVSYFQNLDQLIQTFNAPKSYANAYEEISKFLATIKCGHTFASPFNQSGFINNIILNQKDKLPFGIDWFDDRLFITKNASGIEKIKQGTEILAINGIPTRNLATELLKMTKGDGSKNAKRFKDLSVTGYDTYEMFDVYFPLVVPPQNGKYSVNLAFEDGTKELQG